MDLWERVLGFMDSQALLTAEELGVFDYLDAQPRTLEELAAHSGLPLVAARRLLTMLCALGVTRQTADGRFANSPEASEQLVRGKPDYIGGMFAHVKETLYPTWQYLKDALLEEKAQSDRVFEGQAPPSAELYADPEGLRSFMAEMHSIGYETAAEFARAACDDLCGVRELVDIGGASGAFVIALAEQYPDLRGVVFDLPQVQPIAEDFISAAGLADRVTFQPGDFFEDPLPAGADAYAMGFILHDWPEDQGALLLRKVADVTAPGDRLIVGEYLLADDRSGPLHVARMDLNMLVTALGQERSAREYRDWLAGFGFELRRIYPTSRDKFFLVFARR